MAPGRSMAGANEGAERVVVEARVTGAPMEKAAEPVLGTELIAKERYTSEEYMKLEWKRVWTKVWNIAGREQDIPNFTTDVRRLLHDGVGARVVPDRARGRRQGARLL